MIATTVLAVCLTNILLVATTRAGRQMVSFHSTLQYSEPCTSCDTQSTIRYMQIWMVVETILATAATLLLLGLVLAMPFGKGFPVPLTLNS